MRERDAAVDERLLVHAFARLDPRALALSVGLVSGLALFLATAALLVRAALAPGAPVGPHLGLLAAFFPGYAVSWPGALVGFAYAFAGGVALGGLTALLVNLQHLLYMLVQVRRLRRRELLDGL